MGVRPEPLCPVFPQGGRDVSPGFPGGPGRGGERGPGGDGWVGVPAHALPAPSLFPTMPRHNYRRVAPLVKALCAKHGLSYEVKPFLTALVDIIG